VAVCWDACICRSSRVAGPVAAILLVRVSQLNGDSV